VVFEDEDLLGWYGQEAAAAAAADAATQKKRKAPFQAVSALFRKKPGAERTRAEEGLTEAARIVETARRLSEQQMMAPQYVAPPPPRGPSAAQIALGVGAVGAALAVGFFAARAMK